MNINQILDVYESKRKQEEIEKKKAYNKQYREDHKEEISKRMKEYNRIAVKYDGRK